MVRFVVIEGIDGAGKTTFAARLCDELRVLNYLPVQLAEPTYGTYGRAARRLLAHGEPTLAELHQLFTLDRKEHAKTRVNRLLNLAIEAPDLGMVLIQDRSYYSALAYQAEREADFEKIISEQEAIAPRPEIVFLLDISIDEASRRLRARGDREADFRDSTHLERARKIYLLLASRHCNFCVLDAQAPINELAEKAIREITDGSHRT